MVMDEISLAAKRLRQPKANPFTGEFTATRCFASDAIVVADGFERLLDAVKRMVETAEAFYESEIVSKEGLKACLEHKLAVISARKMIGE